MISKLPPRMLKDNVVKAASLAGNIVTLTMADDTVKQIDFGPYIAGKLAPIAETIAAWDTWLGGSNLQFTYPTTGVTGTPLNWSITGGVPNTTYRIDAGGGLGVVTAQLNAQGAASGQSTASIAGSYNIAAVFQNGAQIVKQCVITSATAPAYNPIVTYPTTAVQNQAFNWSISGAMPGGAVYVVGKSGLEKTLMTISQQGTLSGTSTPLFYGTDSPVFKFGSLQSGFVDVTKNITVHAAAGTILASYCSGYNLMNTVADGAGGTAEVLVQANNTQTCGYSNVIDMSGIPTSLTSSAAGYQAVCSLTFNRDGTWRSDEGIGNGLLTTRTGRIIPSPVIMSNFEIFIGNYEVYFGQYRTDNPTYANFVGRWINLAQGDFGQDVFVYADLNEAFLWSEQNGAANVFPVVVKFSATIRNIQNPGMSSSINVTLTCYANAGGGGFGGGGGGDDGYYNQAN